MNPLLELDNVTTYYGQMRILEGISLQVGAGELVCLLGGNASGKSTTLKTILGIVRPRSGRVLLDGADVTGWAVPQRIARGMAIVPENRRLFGQLTVRENLELGAVLRRGESLSADFDRVHALFPRLLERRNQLAGTLSGGEQQMVAMGRALMSRPRLLLMDEPSMGLSPALVQQNFQIISDIHASGVAVLMVEQNATMALSIADRGYVLSTGSIVLAGSAAELLRHDELNRADLGRLPPCSPVPPFWQPWNNGHDDTRYRGNAAHHEHAGGTTGRCRRRGADRRGSRLRVGVGRGSAHRRHRDAAGRRDGRAVGGGRGDNTAPARVRRDDPSATPGRVGGQAGRLASACVG